MTHEQELNRLSRSIGIAADSAKSETLAKIAYALKNEYKQLEQVNNLDINADNGKVVKSYINKIFDRLIAEGVKF